jgi:hypothetical protein
MWLPSVRIRSPPPPPPPPSPQWPRIASPRSVAIAATSNVKSATNHYHLSKPLLWDGWSPQHELLISSSANCQDGSAGAGFSLPPRAPLCLYQGGLYLDISSLLQTASAMLLHVGMPPVTVIPPPQARHPPSMPVVFCQEVHSPKKTATAVIAVAGSRRAASRSSSSTPTSSKLNHNKRKTMMCKNGLYCNFGNKCAFAHGPDQVKKSTSDELRQSQKCPIEYLSYPCFDYVAFGEW